MALPRPTAPIAALARVLVAGVLACVVATPAAAVVKPREESPLDDALFPKPPIVRRQMRFWEKIFGKFPTTTVIVHEMHDLDRIVDVIDYKAFASRDNRDEPVPRKERDEVTKKYLKRYNKALERFAAEGEKAVRHGAIEKRVHAVYKNDPEALRRLYAGEIKLRAQTGLADDLLRAASTAQAYLPYMEEVFRQYGLPVILTRLPFVESMFNLKARSKVGASGIWQFMPDTARSFIYVTSLVDERNSPFKATRAAAQFLHMNYRDLGAWPLAITAYNHGKLGMAKASKQLGTTDIGRIIERYDSPSFGFASRNFYAEFLAAASVYERLRRSGRLGPAHELPETEAIVLQHRLSVDHLVTHTPLTKEVLAELNPCLLEATLLGNSAKPLPPFYELRIPRSLAPATKTALIGIKNKIYARR